MLIPMSETYSIPEAARLLGISRNVAYAAARTGELAGVPILRIGPKRLLIPRRALDDVLGITTPATTGETTDYDNSDLS